MLIYFLSKLISCSQLFLMGSIRLNPHPSIHPSILPMHQILLLFISCYPLASLPCSKPFSFSRRRSSSSKAVLSNSPNYYSNSKSTNPPKNTDALTHVQKSNAHLSLSDISYQQQASPNDDDNNSHHK